MTGGKQHPRVNSDISMYYEKEVKLLCTGTYFCVAKKKQELKIKMLLLVAPHKTRDDKKNRKGHPGDARRHP